MPLLPGTRRGLRCGFRFRLRGCFRLRLAGLGLLFSRPLLRRTFGLRGCLLSRHCRLCRTTGRRLGCGLGRSLRRTRRRLLLRFGRLGLLRLRLGLFCRGSGLLRRCFRLRAFRLGLHCRFFSLLLARGTLRLAAALLALLLACRALGTAFGTRLTLSSTLTLALAFPLTLHLARRALLATFIVAALLARRTLLAALFGATLTLPLALALPLTLLVTTRTRLTFTFLGTLTVRRHDDLRLDLNEICTAGILRDRLNHLGQRQGDGRLHQQRQCQHRRCDAGEQFEFLRHEHPLFRVSSLVCLSIWPFSRLPLSG